MSLVLFFLLAKPVLLVLHAGDEQLLEVLLVVAHHFVAARGGEICSLLQLIWQAKLSLKYQTTILALCSTESCFSWLCFLI